MQKKLWLIEMNQSKDGNGLGLNGNRPNLFLLGVILVVAFLVQRGFGFCCYTLPRSTHT